VPLLTAVLSAGLLGERLRPAAWLGMGLALLGVGVIASGEAPPGSRRRSAAPTGRPPSRRST
jgi:drug/metabolite transporter (DMT)-like permease